MRHQTRQPMTTGAFSARALRSLGIVVALATVPAHAAAQAAPAALAPPLRGELPPVPAEVFLPSPPGVTVTPYATGLKVIWSLDFAPDGRLFIVEREGRIRVVSANGQLDPTPWLTFEGMEVRLEDGVLGMALHPDFANQPWVYVFYTARKGDQLVNRVSRFREVNGRGTGEEVLIDDLASHRIHNGGRLRFGPDGMLYVTVGEINEPMRSQNMSLANGKILRVTPEGKVPADNPIYGSPIWAIGLRNTHGLAFRPSDGTLFAADNGPTGEWGPLQIRARDELSIVPKGGNLGWPLAVGAPGDPRYADPIAAWIPANPPGDLIFYDGDRMTDLQGDLFYSGLSSQALLRFQFKDPENPNRITAIERWFTGPERGSSVHGRLRGLAIGPDGAIYVGTGNHDGRSPLRPGDDQVLRIAPAN